MNVCMRGCMVSIQERKKILWDDQRSVKGWTMTCLSQEPTSSWLGYHKELKEATFVIETSL